MFDEQRRASVSRVVWVATSTEARLYALCVALAPVCVVGALALTAAELPWWLDLPVFAVGVPPPFLFILSMVEDQAERLGHPLQGWWALKAQLWLHGGGALRQAIGAWNVRTEPGKHSRPDRV